MEITEKFYAFAKYVACPYVRNLDAVKPYVYSVSIILVGSVATGICTPDSDVDICILCPKKVYNEIFPKIEWNNGKYMELTISGINTRYYLESIEDVCEGLTKLDDLTFYLYNYSQPLDDVSGAHKNLKKFISEQQIVAKRKKYVHNSMLKRRRALTKYLDSYMDPFGRVIVAHDTIRTLLRAIAAYDNIPFDPKKHPYITALAGQTGEFLKPCMDELMNCLSKITDVKDVEARKQFIALVDNCITAIT